MVLELARCEFLSRRENVLLLGNSGTGKTHIALALGLAACQQRHRVPYHVKLVRRRSTSASCSFFATPAVIGFQMC